MKDTENGYGKVDFAWSKDYSFIAVCGANRNVYVMDRRGRKLREVPLRCVGEIIGLDWDKDN
jgi:hypothetical protein